GKDFERHEIAAAAGAPVVSTPVREALPDPAAGRPVQGALRPSVRATSPAGGAGPAAARAADSLTES
ncbi:MAG: hypothetical protein ABIV26_03390, partial [Candidatus Limnocylindrales bacterium]